MIKIYCRHCGEMVAPREIKAKGKAKLYTEAWCPECNVAIKGMSKTEARAAHAPELDGITLRQKSKPAGFYLKKMKQMWRRMHPADRFRLYEWIDKQERQEAHGQA